MLLKFAYEDFIADRKFKNTTQTNIDNYNRLLKPFITHCLDKNLQNVEDVNYSDVRDYLILQQEKGNNATTINTKLLRIRAFFNYLLDERIILVNPSKKIKMQKTDIKIDVYTDNQIQQMLAYYRSLRRKEKTYFSYRGYLLIILLLGTGLRKTETINLKWFDVDIKNLTITVFGKNRKRESIYITEKLAKEISYYKSFCEKHFDMLNEYVFVNRDNTQITNYAMTKIFDNLQKHMNFKDVRVSAHTFRHTFCHRLAVGGMSAFAIQKMMRHQNVNVTMRYVAMWGNELREQNDKYNPLNNLDI